MTGWFIAQAAPDLTLWLQIVNSGGVVATLLIGVWMFATGKLVPGSSFDRVLGERNAKDEQIQQLHREAAATASNIQEKVIPALVETTLIMREARRGPT